MPNNEKRTFKDFIKGWKDKNTIGDKVKYYWYQGKQKAINLVKWVKNNPQEAALLGSAIAGVTSIGKKLIRGINLRQERFNKERFVYDRSANCYLFTKRKLNNKDVANINRLRRENPGMKMSEALERLRLLK